MNTHSEPCQLCGRIGCASIQMNQPGRPIDVIGTHWRLGCLERQFVDLRKRVEAMQLATVQPDSKPATVDAQADAAELEQWRMAFVWRKDSMESSWSLFIVRTGKKMACVMPAGDEWLMSGGGRWYLSRDAAMRSVEAVFGLPECRVEGEP